MINIKDNSVINGMIICLPIAFGVFVYGSVFGVLANVAGLMVSEMVAMSIFVFAGAAQFAALDLWHASNAIFEIALATLLINSRYVMITASLRYRMENLQWYQWMPAVHLCADENWAVTMAKSATIGNHRFLLGGGIVLMIFWQSGSLIGFLIGDILPEPNTVGLDFSFTAAFIGLIGGIWKSNRYWIIAFCTALSAIIGDQLLSGSWFIICGISAGVITTLLLALLWPETLSNPREHSTFKKI